MLVLSRRVGESIMIGDTVRVIVIQIDLQKVRLGIDHPRDVVVHREEIDDMLRSEMDALPEQAPENPASTAQSAEADHVVFDGRSRDFLDQLATQLDRHNRLFSQGRAEVIRAIIEAVEESNIDFSNVKTMAELKAAIQGNG